MPRKGPTLAESYPDEVKYWHPTLNGDISPNDVTPHSKYDAWWLCSKGHETQRRIDIRLTHGCQICSLSAHSLETLFPDVAKQWHPTKNGVLTPNEIAAGSNKNVWWLCHRDPSHEWQAQPGNRTSQNQDCPFCTNKRAHKSNCLATLYPDIALDWHPTRNGELTPEKVVAGSHRKVWWRCYKALQFGINHEWQAVIKSRTHAGHGCPTCPRDYTVNDNNLARKFPEVAAEWHPTKNRSLYPSWQKMIAEGTNVRKLSPSSKNRKLKPTDVPPFSSEVVWWQCKKNKDHEWPCSISSRTSNNGGCPFCAGRRVTDEHNLKTEFPAIAKQWHPTRNLPLTPSDVTPGSSKVVWWRCFKSADHMWKAQIAQIVVGRREGHTGCPFCKGRRVAPDNSLAAKRPGLLAQWNTERNLPQKPEEVTPGSLKLVWWKCPKEPDHDWQASIHHMNTTHKRGDTGCPFCKGRKASFGNSLESRYPRLAKQWHKKLNGSLLPSQVTAGSGSQVWWQCPKVTNHAWQARVNSVRASHLRGSSGCPRCKVNVLKDALEKARAARKRKKA